MGAPSTAACSHAISGTNYVVQILEIQTSATCNSIFHVVGIPGTFTLQGRAVQEVLN